MSRWVRRQRWFNRVYAFALAAECGLRGHNYAQHWTLMGLADPEDGERVWCDRCGADR